MEGIRAEEDTLQVDTPMDGIHVAEDTLVVDIQLEDIQQEDIQLEEDSHAEDMVQKGKLHDEGNALPQQHTWQDGRTALCPFRPDHHVCPFHLPSFLT